MPFDPTRTDYAPAQQASIDAWRAARGTLDPKVSAGHLSDAARDLVLAFVALDPLDVAAVTTQLTATQNVITDAMTAQRSLDPVVVGLHDTLAAMATALAA